MGKMVDWLEGEDDNDLLVGDPLWMHFSWKTFLHMKSNMQELGTADSKNTITVKMKPRLRTHINSLYILHCFWIFNTSLRCWHVVILICGAGEAKTNGSEKNVVTKCWRARRRELDCDWLRYAICVVVYYYYYYVREIKDLI